MFSDPFPLMLILAGVLIIACMWRAGVFYESEPGEDPIITRIREFDEAEKMRWSRWKNWPAQAFTTGIDEENRPYWDEGKPVSNLDWGWNTEAEAMAHYASLTEDHNRRQASSRSGGA